MQEEGEPSPGGPERHIPHLDGLRAVAVYLVVAFHADLYPVGGGFIGVDTFFVLSGFLVTGVLLRDVARGGRIDLWRFYARRMRRLLPAAAVNLVVTAVVFSALASPAEVGDATSSMRAAALYVSNWWFIAESADYFGSTVEASPVLHYWSLSVEEQYYLLWPLLLGGLLAVTGARAGRSRRAALTVVVAGVLSAGAALWIARTDLPRAYYGTDTRAYQLLAGAALALAPGTLERLRKARGAARALPLASVAAFAGLLAVATSAVDLAPVSRGVVATALVVVLIATLDAGGPVRWLLSTPPAVYLGRISYGTYLWHWLVVIVARREVQLSDPSLFALTVLLASGLAALSAQLLEQPVRTSGLLDRVARPVVAVGIALSLLVGLLVVPSALDGVSTAGVDVTAANGTPVPSSALAAIAAEPDPDGGCDLDRAQLCPVHEGSGTRVLLLGDSHAAMLVPAFVEVARRHDLDIAGVFMRACPWIRNLQLHWPDPLRCYGMQAEALDELVPAYDPDVVVLVHNGFDDPLEPSTIMIRGFGAIEPDPAREPLVAERVRATVSQLREAGRRVVLVEPIPVGQPRHLTPCLAAATFVEECRQVASVDPSPEEELFRRLDAGDDGIWSLDLDRRVCPFLPICDPIVDGEPVRLDSSHLSAAFTEQLADPIEQFLVDNGVLVG